MDVTIMALLRRRATLIILALVMNGQGGATAAKFTLINKCSQTIWPAVQGTPVLETTGFDLEKGASRAIQAPNGWSGRFWARTGCKFDESGKGTCVTGDCGGSGVECDGAGASAVTLAEFTIGSSSSMDFYDVSLVDGYNLPVTVEATGGSGQCASTGCVEDINQKCPSELKTDDGGACRSACGAFNTAEYCCKGEYGSPATCRPSAYAQMFKTACPKSYSYAYDDATSTFTCASADYVITFCPSSLPSQKSSKPDESSSSAETPPDSGRPDSKPGSFQTAVMGNGDESWLADLAAGGADPISRPSPPASVMTVVLLAIWGVHLDRWLYS